MTAESRVGLEDPREAISPSASPTSQHTLFTDSHDSKSTASSSRGSSPASKTSSHHTPKHVRPRSGFWFGSSFSNHILCPRSYEQIYAESSYLNRSLQIQSINTAELINRYSLVQEALLGEAAVGKHRRKLRKQFSLLKSKISQASQQEKAIIIRLGELQVEKQSRDAWDQIQRRRMSSQAAATRQPIKRPATSPEYNASPGKPLDATSLEFIPSRNFVLGQEDSQFLNPQCKPTNKAPRLDTVDEEECSTAEGEENDSEAQGYKTIDDLHNHGLEYTYETCDKVKPSQSLSQQSESIRRSIMDEKRLSLPSLNFIWPEA